MADNGSDSNNIRNRKLVIGLCWDGDRCFYLRCIENNQIVETWRGLGLHSSETFDENDKDCLWAVYRVHSGGDNYDILTTQGVLENRAIFLIVKKDKDGAPLFVTATTDKMENGRVVENNFSDCYSSERCKLKRQLSMVKVTILIFYNNDRCGGCGVLKKEC